MTIDRERIALIRNGDHGIALTIYLDVPDATRDEWHNTEGWSVGIFDAPACAAIIELLKGLSDDWLVIANDEAGRAMSLLQDAGEDRQAWVAGMLEALLRTRTYPESKRSDDPLDGLALDQEQNRKDWRRMMQERGLVYKDGRSADESPVLSADDAVSAVERLLGSTETD